MAQTDPDTDDGNCPVCEQSYTRRAISTFGGTIDHEQQLTQDRTCFYPFDHEKGAAVTALYYHVDDGDPDPETIHLDDD